MTARADVSRLLEQLYDAIDRPNINRTEIRELTDDLSTLCMVQAEPTVNDILVEMSDIGMTLQQAKIVELLARQPGKTYTAEAVLRAITVPGRDPPGINVIRVLVYRIRQKLAAHKKPYHVESIWGVGYRVHKLSTGERRHDTNGGRKTCGNPNKYEALDALVA